MIQHTIHLPETMLQEMEDSVDIDVIEMEDLESGEEEKG